VTVSEILIAEAKNILCQTPAQAEILRRLIDAYAKSINDTLRLEAVLHEMRK
jgi:hypothetical protein